MCGANEKATCPECGCWLFARGAFWFCTACRRVTARRECECCGEVMSSVKGMRELPPVEAEQLEMKSVCATCYLELMGEEDVADFARRIGR